MRTHSWWAVVILLIVDATICASFAFAHVHVSLMSDVCPPAGARLPDLGFDIASVAAWLGSALLMEIVRRWNVTDISTRSKVMFGIVIALALTGAGIGFAANAWGHLDAGLTAEGQRVERDGDDTRQLSGIARRGHHADGALT